MATTEDVILQIAGLGYVFEAPVDTEPMDLDTFRFGVSSTYGAWNWIGDTSSENMVEFSVDGGETDTKRTWARTDVRAVTTPESVSATINSVNLHTETFKLAFSGANINTAKNRVEIGSNSGSTARALLIVMQDPATNELTGLWLPQVSIKGSFPTLSIEEFTEIPLTINVLASLKHAISTGFIKWAFVTQSASD